MTMNDSSATVFVVDDDASVRDSVKTLLKSVGLQAEVFGSTEEFIQIERPETPSCLILDVRLPCQGLISLDTDSENFFMRLTHTVWRIPQAAC
jgi:FixJ family two-component response regulator